MFSRGFTIIELLVTVAILALLSATLFFNTQAPDTFRLNKEAQRLAANARLIQEKALSSEDFSGNNPDGWGLYFDTSNPKQYILFADTNDNQVYDGSGEQFDRVQLDDPVSIRSVNNSQATVTYVPPRPRVVFSPASLSEIVITMEASGVSDLKTITITSNGSVDVQ